MPQGANPGLLQFIPTPVTTIDGDAYTLKGGDNFGVVVFTGSSAATLTVPPGLNREFQCSVIQAGSGQVDCVAGSGAALHNRQSQTHTAGQWAVVGIIAIEQDTFVLAGDTA